MDGMLDAVQGCLKEEARMDLISNNLANASVIGFKKDRICFQDLLKQAGEEGGSAQEPAPSLIDIQTDFSPGDVRSTGNEMDFVISGKGFFKIETPEGIRYSRKGDFRLDSEGFLVNQQGFRVMGKGGPIALSGTRIEVDSTGVIEVDGGQAGQIDLVDFEDYEGLLKEGQGLFRHAGDSPEMPPPAETVLGQGYLELSNVSPAEEMVQMIHCMRAFESYQKAIQVIDGINNRVVNEVSRLR